MKYEEILELLPDYALGRLSGEQAEAVRAAIAQAPDLERELERAKKYAAAIEALPPIKAPGDFVDRVNRAIDRRKSLWRRLFVPLWPKLPFELAGLGVAVILTTVIFNPFTLKNVPREVLDESSKVVSAPSPVLSESAVAPEGELSGAGPEPQSAAEAVHSRESAPASRPGPVARDTRTEVATADVPRQAPPAKPRATESGFAPEPPANVGGVSNARYASGASAAVSAPSALSDDGDKDMVAPAAPVPQASPAPAAELAMDAEQKSKGDLALERRRLKQESEAVSVMTLAIDDRSVDRVDVADGKRGRSRDSDSQKKTAAGAAESAPSRTYASVADKAFSVVESVVIRHGGSITLRSSMSVPNPQRTYVVSMPRSSFERARAELASLGGLRDVDLNLDAGDAERVTFRLGVTVE